MKYFFLFDLIFCFIAANAQEPVKNNFVLSGKIIGQDTGMVRLVYPDINGKFILDTSWLKKGVFSFKGYISEPTFATLYGNVKSRSSNDPNLTDLFLEQGKMKTELKVNDFKNGILTGSKTNVELREIERVVNEAHKKNDNVRESMNARYNFIKEHPKSYVGPTQMWPFLSFYPYDTIRMLFRTLDATVQNSIYGRQLAKELAKADSSDIGSKAKNFVTVDVNGKQLTLSSFKGKYVLLDFWASWCVPCRRANPELRAFYRQYFSHGLEIISVSYDEDPRKWKDAIKKDSIRAWHHVRARSDFEKSRQGMKNDSDIIEKFAVPYIPFLILIDRNGIIIGRYGSNDNGPFGLKNKLEEVFTN